MKPGLEVGQTHEFDIKVTKEMRAQFGEETVHDLYSTSALVHHMEWASRKLLIPYLESHEEGMGSHVEVSHLMLTPTNTKVRIRATVLEIRDRKLVCEVEAFNVRGKIARGTVTQTVVELAWVQEKMKEMAIIDQLATANESTTKISN